MLRIILLISLMYIPVASFSQTIDKNWLNKDIEKLPRGTEIIFTNSLIIEPDETKIELGDKNSSKMMVMLIPQFDWKYARKIEKEDKIKIKSISKEENSVTYIITIEHERINNIRVTPRRDILQNGYTVQELLNHCRHIFELKVRPYKVEPFFTHKLPPALQKKEEERKKKLEEDKIKKEKADEVRKKKAKADAEAKAKADAKAKAAAAAEAKRKVDAAAKSKLDGLIGGSYNVNGGGKGNTGEPGNQGDSNGNPNSDVLTGVSDGAESSVGGGLSGRGVKRKPAIKDTFNKAGKVVLTVCVDRSGNVTSALFKSLGSTVTHSDKLIAIAKKNAKSYKFDSGILDKQCGTITYRFKVR